MAVVHSTKHLARGSFLAAGFLAVLLLIFLPLFPGGENGLEFADRMFNRLSKGSSNFIPGLVEQSRAYEGRPFVAEVPAEGLPAPARGLLEAAGVVVMDSGPKLRLEGDLGRMLAAALEDAAAMYANDGPAVANRYGVDEREALVAWWGLLGRLNKALALEKKVPEAKIVSDVNKKAVEPAYNFYGIEAQSVKEKAGTMSALLVFYVLYTIWWGFAIFFIFEGLGLSMKKAKVKKEV